MESSRIGGAGQIYPHIVIIQVAVTVSAKAAATEIRNIRCTLMKRAFVVKAAEIAGGRTGGWEKGGGESWSCDQFDRNGLPSTAT